MLSWIQELLSMNAYGQSVLAFCVFHYLVGLVADVLNISALSPEIPKEFRDVYDASDYAKSQSYTRAKTMFSRASELYSMATFIGVWWFGRGFSRLDDFSQVVSDHYIVQGLTFFGIYTVIETLLGLPFDLYHTFVLEERFGFNRTTMKTFVTDKIKGLGLMAVIGGVLLSGLLWFFHSMGDKAWLYSWGLIATFTIVLQYIAPVFILPLFNKLEPIEEGELQDAINGFAAKVGFDFGGIFVIDGSKRSSHSNAFFTGFGSSKRICLFDTLIKTHTLPELVAVLAHEIGHYKMLHIIQGTVLGIAQTGLVLYVVSAFLSSKPLFEAFFVERVSLHVGLVLASLLYSPISLFASVIMNMRSRHNEFEADRYSCEHYGNGAALADGLRKLAKENSANLTPHPVYVFLNYSHPPMLERLRAIREFGKKD